MIDLDELGLRYKLPLADVQQKKGGVMRPQPYQEITFVCTFNTHERRFTHAWRDALKEKGFSDVDDPWDLAVLLKQYGYWETDVVAGGGRFNEGDFDGRNPWSSDAIVVYYDITQENLDRVLEAIGAYTPGCVKNDDIGRFVLEQLGLTDGCAPEQVTVSYDLVVRALQHPGAIVQLHDGRTLNMHVK